MSVRTSYFGRSFHNPDAVAVTLKTPAGFPNEVASLLAPDAKIVFGGGTKRDYVALLNRRGITAEWVLEKYEGKILLCYEKDRSKCHRGWLAEWIFEQTGVVVEELGVPEKPPADEDVQLEMLF